MAEAASVDTGMKVGTAPAYPPRAKPSDLQSRASGTPKKAGKYSAAIQKVLGQFPNGRMKGNIIRDVLDNCERHGFVASQQERISGGLYTAFSNERNRQDPRFWPGDIGDGVKKNTDVLWFTHTPHDVSGLHQPPSTLSRASASPAGTSPYPTSFNTGDTEARPTLYKGPWRSYELQPRPIPTSQPDRENSEGRADEGAVAALLRVESVDMPSSSGQAEVAVPTEEPALDTSATSDSAVEGTQTKDQVAELSAEWNAAYIKRTQIQRKWSELVEQLKERQAAWEMEQTDTAQRGIHEAEQKLHEAEKRAREAQDRAKKAADLAREADETAQAAVEHARESRGKLLEVKDDASKGPEWAAKRDTRAAELEERAAKTKELYDSTAAEERNAARALQKGLRTLYGTEEP
ncbi:hypothetical protein LTR49_022524 [Elasticomyces elasticus]|nr:hypothetical protein LTR49_022524 [Elasticomyces elasticus]